MDHDIMFTTRTWYGQLCRAVAQHPKGTFVPYVYRGGAPWQKVQNTLPDIQKDVHDIRYHREIGDRLARMNEDKLVDVTEHPQPPGGTLILLSKEVWRAVGGFEPGCFMVDHRLFQAIYAAGFRIYLMHGVYIYHWKRAAGEDHPALPSCSGAKRGQDDYPAH
jgi:hypothetical protein